MIILNKNHISFIDHIVNFYSTTFKTEVEEMSTTTHSFLNKDGSTLNLNPYHGEGNIWAHVVSMLGCYKSYISQLDTYQPSYDDVFIMTLAILTHDYGKVYTRNQDNYKQKTTFYNHAFFSTKHCLDATDELFKKFEMNEDKRDYIFSSVASIVSNHMLFYENKNNKENRIKIGNYNNKLLKLFILFKYVDSLGSVNVRRDESDYITELKTDVQLPNIDDCNIILYSGLPSSGKDTYAAKDGRKIFSKDIERIELYETYKKSKDESYIINKQFYLDAFHYSIKEKINMDELVLKKIFNTFTPEEIINEKIAICNTFLRTKDIIYYIKELKKYNKNLTIGNKVIMLSESKCIKRDLIRIDKSVGIETFNNMKRYQFPSMLNGFDSIKFIYNELL